MCAAVEAHWHLRQPPAYLPLSLLVRVLSCRRVACRMICTQYAIASNVCMVHVATMLCNTTVLLVSTFKLPSLQQYTLLLAGVVQYRAGWGSSASARAVLGKQSLLQSKDTELPVGGPLNYRTELPLLPQGCAVFTQCTDLLVLPQTVAYSVREPPMSCAAPAERQHQCWCYCYH